MQIRQAQWDSIGREAFVRRLVALLRRHHPDRTASLDDDELGAEVRRQFTRAIGYGLADERSAATYIHSAWLLGQAFDERIPGVRQILLDPSLAAARKAAALNDFTRTVFATLAPSAGEAR
jgi:hypothetical protein